MKPKKKRKGEEVIRAMAAADAKELQDLLTEHDNLAWEISQMEPLLQKKQARHAALAEQIKNFLHRNRKN